MKTLFITLLFVCLLSLHAHAQLLSADVGVNGMTCSMCARGTEETLRHLDFIDSIDVDLNTLVAHITFKKSAEIPVEKIVQAVEDAGFSVRNISVVFNFSNEKVADDKHIDYGNDIFAFMGTGDQTLNGPVTLRFIDKPFVTKKEFKNWSKKTSMKCYANNKMDSCCPPNVTKEKHLFHVTTGS
jgi:copper chaperone CopZ